MVDGGVEHVVRLVVDYVPFVVGDLQRDCGAGWVGNLFGLFFLSIESASRSYDFTVDDIPPTARFEGDPPSVGPKNIIRLTQ